MIRVVLADDQELVRHGFRALLDHEDDLDVVGEAANGSEAVDRCFDSRPDVVIMDVRMPDMDGIEATRRIAADPRLSNVRVLILTTFDLDEYVYQALQAGASGFLLKDVTPTTLLSGIRTVAAGEALLAPSVVQRLVTAFAARPDPSTAEELTRLTDREREVLVQVARGRSNAELAAELAMSPLTAKTHVSRVLAKTGCRDRAQLVALAYETGMLTPGG